MFPSHPSDKRRVLYGEFRRPRRGLTLLFFFSSSLFHINSIHHTQNKLRVFLIKLKAHLCSTTHSAFAKVHLPQIFEQRLRRHTRRDEDGHRRRCDVLRFVLRIRLWWHNREPPHGIAEHSVRLPPKLMNIKFDDVMEFKICAKW